MFFLIPENKWVLLFYIAIILLGIILEYFGILRTEETIGIGLLLVLIPYVIQLIKEKN